MLLAAMLGGACGLSDLFKPPGLAQVTLTYPKSDTILVLGTTTRPAITVQAGGVDVLNPHVRLVSWDTTIIALTASGDSLIARKLGSDTITVVLLDPIFTDTLPTIKQFVRVRP